MEATKQMVDKMISSNKVMVFSKSYCPFCIKAISTLKSMQPNGMEILQIEDRSDMSTMQDYLLQITGGKTVPRVFVGGKFVGGCSETEAAYKNGSLKTMLQEVGAL